MINNKFEPLITAFEKLMPFNNFLGLSILKLEEGYTKIHIPFKEDFIGDYYQKRWHGGVLASITDSAGGIVALTTISDLSERVSTIDMRIDYLHGSEPKDIYAEAKFIKKGKRIVKVDVELYHEKSKIIAIARCAFSVLRTK